jgi:CRP/FNR family cyclic AMP-dependent transcriptional regulator
LRATSEQIEAIALHTIEVRLARFLLAALALRGQGEAGMQPIALDLGMSQTELGLLLGASRSKVNEAMAALEQVGAVHRSEGRVACNQRALQDVAQSG